MAEIILGPIVELILGKLVSVASDEVRLLRTLKPEIEKLQITLETIHSVLLDAEEKQSHDNQVKLWLERISDIMYDAEDLLDDISTEAALRKQAGARKLRVRIYSKPNRLLYDRKIAHDIKAIREKLDDISKQEEAFKLETRTQVEALPSFRETDSCPPTIVVGRDDDKKKIIDLLLNSNAEANISVVSIVGLGGLGKTTLAQVVFNDNQVKAHFDIKVWVYVSPSFNFTEILRKMLQSVNGGSQTALDLDISQTQLRESIRGKRFLLVLDDVWEETSSRRWDSLEKYLTAGASGSKVLLTTRSTRVAEVGGGALMLGSGTSIVEPYRLKGLSEQECWDLLVRRALRGEVPEDPKVREIGKQILSKCAGVPLVVSTIAAMLAVSGDPKKEWSSFLEKDFSTITEEGGEGSIRATLQVSFNHLPSHMKRCFTYCALFGKGFEFEIPMLVRLWVVQGYIESEDEGYKCFKTLWWRSFFQEVKMDESGNLSTCGMHDLMHDLVDTIAGETIKRSSSPTVLRNVPSKARHLCITRDDSTEEVNGGVGLEDANKVRTLICFGSLSNEELEHVLNNFLRLRVLIIIKPIFHAEYYETSLHSVGKLKHLRYLGLLRFTEMRKLPDSVTKLVNLQVLNLFDGWSIEELPRDAKKLVNLKHIELEPECSKCLTHIPKGIGELKSLQTLPVFVVGRRVGAGLDELKELNELRGELTIRGLAHADSPRKGVYPLKEKLHLQSLSLRWWSRYYGDNDVTPTSSTHDEGILEMLWPHPNLKKLIIDGGYQGVKFPNWLSSLTNLVEFSFIGCKRCEYLPLQMHQISSFKKLTIKDCPMLKGINNDSSPYNSTRRSTTEEEEDDDEWPRFDCLSYLRIQNCPSLTWLPTFPTIEGELVLENASLALFAKTMKMKMQMRRGGGDIDTNVHPPSSSSSSSTSSSSALVHPLSKLTKLKLDEIDDDLESLSLPDSSSCLGSLEKLNVENCNRGVKLPDSLCSSIYLTKISISDCGMVEYLPPLHELPSLRKLKILSCPELKGCWWKKKKKKQQQRNNNDDYYNFDPSISMEGDKDEEEEEEEEEEWPHFPCLSTLRIEFCPNLTRMPLFPTVEDRLYLRKTSTEALVRTMKMKPVVASSSSSSSSPGTALVAPLSKLTELTLWEMEDLECLPEEGLRNLTSLQELNILKCPRLACQQCDTSPVYNN